MIRTQAPVLLFLYLLICQVSVANADENRPLIIGVHPYLPAVELTKRFTPLINYLSNKTAIPIKLNVSKNYEAHIENIGNNIVDIAYLGPSSYVELVSKHGQYPLLARLEVNGKPFFNGYIVAKQGSGIIEIKQLKGRKFAFGSPRSTMSYRVPRFLLRESGVKLTSLSDYKFLGNHRNVALSVLLGEFDAGAVKEEIYFKFRKKGLTKIALSPPISEHLFVARKNLSPIKIKAIQEAMFGMSRSVHGLNVLKTIKKTVTGLVPVKDENYNNLREIMK